MTSPFRRRVLEVVFLALPFGFSIFHGMQNVKNTDVFDGDREVMVAFLRDEESDVGESGSIVRICPDSAPIDLIAVVLEIFCP